MAVGAFGWWIRGIEPHADPAWMVASPSGRLEFWTQVATWAAEEWDAQVADGRGADGKKLVAITAETRRRRGMPGYSPMGKASPSAPPLIPCYGRSRTRSLLRSMAYPTGVYFYWDFDTHTEREWGEILDAHRTGFATGRKRDVFGLMESRKAAVKAKAWAWWGRNRKRLAARGFGERTEAAEGIEIRLNLGVDEGEAEAKPRAQQQRARRMKGSTVERVRVGAGVVHVESMTGAAPTGPVRNDTGFREKRVRGR